MFLIYDCIRAWVEDETNYTLSEQGYAQILATTTPKEQYTGTFMQYSLWIASRRCTGSVSKLVQSERFLMMVPRQSPLIRPKKEQS
ncbi:unnamed protein product [Gongylonema pulchrum]|uniref:Transposase n=1 Tax=Gongylonema pulchrum TaxID=637853 RepID=A0A183EG72_9BILA|nr:unnamed protein product [Gongylonema pulchrum]